MSKLKISKFFCKSDDAYEGIIFKSVKSTIKNLDGSIVANLEDLIMPAHWSNNAIDIMARNYLRKKGIPTKLKKIKEEGIYSWIERSESDSDEQTFENDARKVFDRLAGAWTYWGIKGNYFETEQDSLNFYNETRYMLAMQMAAPNSPQWFNTGIHWAYGIEGSAQGHYYFDEDKKELLKSTSAYIRPQPHACFIQSVQDNLVSEGGIMDLWKKEALLFKYGSGTGTNFSNIRSSGERLSGGGFSSGLMSFLKIGDVAGGSIKSGGTTRRAAKMVILNIDHPEIEAFIKWKNEEENKVLDFFVGAKIIKMHTKKIEEAFNSKTYLKIAVDEAMKAGVPEAYIIKLLLSLKSGYKFETKEYTLNWDSEAYGNVFGQNSNNSVRITDKFLNNVINDEDFELKYRGDGKVAKTLKARYLWEEIGKAAWGCADPGLQFDTTINSWNTCANSGRINAANPCSEYMFLDDTACNLASLNLIKFMKNDQFDIDGFMHAARIWTIILEISIYMAQFPSEKIALLSYQFRTLGLGFGNLGALLMQSAISYDSEEGRNTAAGITALMQGIAYKTSAEIASFKGPFEKFEENKECMMKVIKNHQSAALNEKNYINLNIEPVGFDKNFCIFENLSKKIPEIWKETIEMGSKYGYRNAQVSVIAPTGTIGLIMDFKTTGVEPQFAQILIKQLSGGGVMKFVNDDISKALKKLKYSEIEIEAISNYVTGHASFDGNFKLNKQWLYNKGFLIEEIELMENELKKSFDIMQAFAVLPESFYLRMNLSKNENILKQLNATNEEIESANLYCCGHMTIEGAPYLKEEHLSIFDCSMPCGNGVRSLSYESHIKMMAAIQPFISGAISKTINLPNLATIQECLSAYMLSWKLGLKAVALYRDGSKYSQVLNTKNKTKILEDFYKEETFQGFNGKGYTKNVLINNIPLFHSVSEDNTGIIRNISINFGKEGSTLRGWISAWSTIFSLYLKKKGNQALLKTYKAFKHSKFEPLGIIKGHNSIAYANSIPDYIVEDLMLSYPDALNTQLEPSELPNQRDGKINKIKIGQETLYLIIGEDENGLPCEIFVAGMGNEGSDLKGWMNSCTKLISLYFQDCKKEAILEFIENFEGSTFAPAGIVRGNELIRSATSPLDFLAKYLKIKYAKILSQTQTVLIEENSIKKYDNSNQDLEIKLRAASGYKVDEPCKSCKAFKLRYNGTCFICDNCFTTTGCS